MEAWQQFRSVPNFATRASFWMKYLYDVVPEGVLPCHVPANTQMFDIHPPEYPNSRRMEIQLRCMEGILLTGVVSQDWHNPYASNIAAILAYEHWRDGLVVYDPYQAWGIFTCITTMRFSVSDNGRDYRDTLTVHPITNVWDVVNYIQHEYDRIRVR